MDADEIHKLLNIAHGTLSFPKLRAIHDAAMAKLLQHAAEIAESPKEIAEAVEEEETKNERRA